jgi:hypothetical protein
VVELKVVVVRLYVDVGEAAAEEAVMAARIAATAWTWMGIIVRYRELESAFENSFDNNQKL